MSENEVAKFSPRSASVESTAVEGETVEQRTDVEVLATGNAELPYVVLVVASTWTSLNGQTLEITFNLSTKTANASFPSADQAVVWVPEPPVTGTFSVTVADANTLIVKQENYNRGPGNTVFDFRIGVDVDGTTYYSSDPTIINSPIGG